MWIKLDKTILRGYYVSSGGTVYVEDVDREVNYATGEEYNYNVAAFKSFLYRMLNQTTQFVVGWKKDRLQSPSNTQFVARGRSRGASTPKPKLQHSSSSSKLYHLNDWIPMMLGMLRSQKVNIGDPDIISHFVDEPYFSELYKRLLPREKRKVDAYLRRFK